MAFRSSDYPLTGLGHASGQNSDASSETSLTLAAGGGGAANIAMTDFIVDNTDGVTGPDSLSGGASGVYEQQFVGESSRFSVIKEVNQNFNWSSDNPNIVSVSAGNFTATATGQGGGTANVTNDFHDRYNTVSSQSGGSKSVFAGCDFSGTSPNANFDTITTQNFPTVRSVVTISTTDGQNGDYNSTQYFEVCEDNQLQTVDNVVFDTGNTKLDFLVTFDTSGSMGSYRDTLVTELKSFINDVENEGFNAEYGLTEFEAQTTNSQTRTTNGSVFRSSVDGINVSGGSEPGWDAIGVALNKTSDGNGVNMGPTRDDAQKVLLTVSDEPSNSNSIYTRSDAVGFLQNEQVEYKAISPSSTSSDHYRSVAQELGSNGEWFDIAGNVSAHFNTIFDNLTSPTYRVFYDTSQSSTDGSTRTTDIRITPPSGSSDSQQVVSKSYTAPTS